MIQYKSSHIPVQFRPSSQPAWRSPIVITSPLCTNMRSSNSSLEFEASRCRDPRAVMKLRGRQVRSRLRNRSRIPTAPASSMEPLMTLDPLVNPTPCADAIKLKVGQSEHSTPNRHCAIVPPIPPAASACCIENPGSHRRNSGAENRPVPWSPHPRPR